MKPRTRLAEKLLSTCAIGAAIVALGGAGRLLAQDTGNVGFEGDPGSPPGVAIYRDYQHDEVDVTADKAVINWTPYDTSGSGPIDFLPAGHSVDYIGINGQDFTVLNRILPGGALEPIELNGAINSYILANDVRSTGGSVWFYSPGGIIVGSTAAFNVGGLLLTANDIPLDATGSFDPNTVRFVGAPGGASSVTINSGAQINAAQYVALIAPKIVQAGSIRADGQIAYIAAEKGTLTMPMGGGLFSISVDVDGGTSAGGTVIDHSGTTGGPAGTDPNLPHRIYMVTVAKNDAVTMLLGGNIGFDAASSATTDGDAVVLSAGRDVLNGDAVLTGAAIGAPASIQLTNTNVTSLLTANASGDLTLLADSGGTLSLAADTTAVADGTVTAHAAANSTITAGGNLTLTSARYGLDAGTAQVLADKGGAINVAGALNVIADADGSVRGYAGGGDAHGGTASLMADGGAITAGQINVSAVGIAQPLGTTKTTSYGGVASVTLTNNASLTAGGLLIDASAGESLSGFVGSNPGGLGADAQGGTASLTMTGGALNLTSGPLDIYASAQGGDGLDGGDATGGNAGFTMNGGTANLSGLYVDAGGFGGNALSVFAGEGGPPVSGGKGGDGKGGTVQALVNGGAFTSTYADMYAEGSGGNGGDAYDQIGTGNGGNGGVGGIGTGGSVGFEVDAGSATANNIYLSAFASGGQGGYSDDAVAGNGGDGVGGDVSLLTNGVRAQATFTTTYLDAGARGGTGGFSYQALAADVRGGNAAGGSVSMLAKAGMLLAGDATLSAVGTGGIAGRDENGFGIGGDARGGNVTAGSAGGALSLTSLLLDVDAFGGSGGGLGMEDFSAPRNGGGLLQPMQGPGALPAVQGGNATGGSATLSATAGGTVTVANGLTLTAQGTGGDGMDVAGSGTGGSVSLLANSGGTISAAAAGGLAGLSAKGQGGAGGTAGGNGSGGTVIVTADKGAIDLAGGGEWYADGTGGNGANGDGGAGTGGTVTAKALNGGSIDAAGLTVGASGIGGQSTGGTGGLGQGGTILLSAQSGVISVADDSGPLELTATAEGTGGGGDTGGKGVGGGISLGATGANASISADLLLNADGSGGTGSTLGGAGVGGSLTLNAAQGGAIANPTTNARTWEAYGTGGGGATGGAGTGGVIAVTADGGTVTLAGKTEWHSDGKGGAGSNGDGGAGVSGNVTARALNGGTLQAAGLVIGTTGFGGQSSGGTGGLGQGGDTLISAQNGTITIADANGPLELQATSQGEGGGGTTGGQGIGGGVTIEAIGANALVSSMLRLDSTGFGGTGVNVGGEGVGGSLKLDAEQGGQLQDQATDSRTWYVSGVGGGGSATGGKGVGGTILVQALTGATISIAHPLTLAATGFGGAGDTGGDAAGGTVDTLLDGGTLTAPFYAEDASATGGDGVNGAGGDAQAGSALLSLTGGSTMNIGSVLNLNADGTGGASTNGAGGAGTGGAASALIDASTLSLASSPSLLISATGTGGSGVSGGAGAGGTASLELGGGTLDMGGGDLVISTASGGGAATGNGAGGKGVGGTTTLTLDRSETDPNAVASLTAGTIELGADGYGGDNSCSGSGCTGGAGGVGQAGSSTVGISAGTLTADSLTLYANAQGGLGGFGAYDSGSGAAHDGGAGGDTVGGSAGLTVSGGTLSVGALDVEANGYGGGGGASGVSGDPAGGKGGAGGKGVGGAITLNVDNGRIVRTGAATITLNAQGEGGLGGDSALSVGGTGGAGQGGGLTVSISGANSDVAFAQLLGVATGIGGQGGASASGDSAGGAGTGGTAALAVNGGTVQGDDVTLTSEGDGGIGGADAQGLYGIGGAGTGGSASLSVTGGSAAIGTAEIGADGLGGSDSEAILLRGGNGVGGNASVSAANGALTLASLTAAANGAGSAGQASGGVGTGGMVTVGAQSGGAMSIGNSLILAATGIGGASATADGFGTGGTAILAADGGALSIPDGAGIGAFGQGAGGTAIVRATLGGVITGAGSLTLDATAAGGAAKGGNAELIADAGSITLAGDLDLLAYGKGASGTGGAATLLLTNSGGADPVVNIRSVNLDADGESSAGDARGGTATLRVEAGQLTLASASTLSASGVASNAAGNGTGGTVSIVTAGAAGESPAIVADGITLTADGTGSGGGNGAGGAITIRAGGSGMTLGALTAEANGAGGGASGKGMGGSISLAANGAPLTADATSLTVNGDDAGAGGTIALSVADAGGASGSVSLGDTHLSASGGVGGRVTLSDTSAAAAPALRLASLEADVLGTPASGGPSFALTAAGNRIAVAGDASITTGGDQSYVASGAGGLDIGGSWTATANGALTFTHDNNGGGVDTVHAGDADLSGQTITVKQGAILGADRTMTLFAGGDIDAASLHAGSSIDGRAGGAVTLGDATVTASARRGEDGKLDSSIGRISFAAGATDGPNYAPADLTVTGTLSANGLIELTAGNDIHLASGAALRSANLIGLDAGNDILVDTGASIVAGQAPLDDDPANGGLHMSAGQLALTTPLASGNVASIIADGALSSGGSPMHLLGGAIVVTQPITASDLTADIAGTATGSDGGQLSGDCQGRDICLGTLAVAGDLSIGQGTYGAPDKVSIADGSVGGAMLVNAGDGISLGRDGAASNLTVNGNATLASGGGIALLGTLDLSSGGDLALNATGGLAGANATIKANRTMTLDAGGGIDVGSLHAGSSIDGRAGGALTIANAVVDAPAQRGEDGRLDASIGRISLVAGATDGTNYAPADLTVTGTLSANGLIELTAGNDIHLASGAALQSANLIGLDAGNDILVDTGASIAAGQAPLDDDPANGGLHMSAGQLALTTPLASGNVASIIADGALSSGGSPMHLLGGAIVVTQPITAGDLTADIAGTATGSDGGQLSGDCQGRDICLGTLVVSGDLSIGQGTYGAPDKVSIADGSIGGAMLVNAGDGISLGRAGADATLAANGGGRLVSGGAIDMLGALNFSTGGNLGLRAAGDIGGADASIDADGDVALTTGGNLRLSDLFVQGALTGADAEGNGSGLAGIGGSATLGTLAVYGGDIRLTAPGGITIGQVYVRNGRVVALDARNAALNVTDITGSEAGVAGSISLNGGSVTADRLQASGAVTLTATGAVAVTTDVAASGVTAKGSTVDINALGPLVLTSIVATNGDATARSGGDLSVAAGQASGNLTLTSAGTATLNGAIGAGNMLAVTGQGIAINGTLKAPRIAFRSAAMTIGSAARIGYAGVTQKVSFTDSGSGPSFIGGTGGDGYSLTNAGLSRVQSQDIAISLPGDVTIGSLSLTGAGGTAANLGGALTISTPGAITVNGAVALTGATAANMLELDAGPSITVVTPSGSIAITDTAKAPVGTLVLNAGTIAVASQAALTDIANAADISARDARLATNDGAANDQGYLAAGTMRFSIADGLYIQNSGADSSPLADRRGFTVGDGGLTIATVGEGPAEIVINGRQIGADGVAITGDALIAKVSLNGALAPNGVEGPARFDPLSTINGCKITAGSCPTTPDQLIPQTLVFVRDTISNVLTDDQGDTQKSSSSAAAAVNGAIPPIIIPAITLTGLTPFSFAPPIDEPIIGVGNEDLWSGGGNP